MSEKEADPVIINEVVQVDFSEGAQKVENDFAAVVFHSISETYPVDAHIECRYTLTSDIVPTTRDWVGLYKVGWMSPRDYIYYEWAPIPKDYEVGMSAESSVLFQAHNLPGDDGDFYQFCYVASSSQIRGASTPFQFRKPSADEFVEVEDPDTDMLVIRSKTVFLQENLVKAEAENTKLKETRVTLQSERDGIAAKYAEIKKKLALSEQNSDVLKERVKSSETQIGQLHREARDMMAVHDELRSKLGTLNKEKAALDDKIMRLNSEIAELTTELKKIQSEKDQISGEKRAIEEQVDLYKSHFTSSENSANQYSKQLEKQQICLAEKESLIDHLKKAVRDLELEAEQKSESLDRQMAVMMLKEEQIEQCEEQLKNAEDKLKAAEESKTMMQSEIQSYKDAQSELTAQIEKSKSECHSLKQKLNVLEEDFQIKIQIQESEMDQAKRDLMASLEEKRKLQEENSQLKQRVTLTLEETDTRSSSMSCMKKALEDLKELLSKKSKQCQSLEKALNQREMEYRRGEHELKREIEDLKERIFMCSEEYKSLYNKQSKLHKRYEKVVGKKKLSRQNSSGSHIVVEKLQTSGLNGDQETTDVEVLDTSSSCGQIDQSVADFDAELQRRREKKKKYKKMFVDEREKLEALKAKHLEDLSSKEQEISRLKKKIEDVPNNLDMKVRALENCVTEKERIIEELNQKLRETNQERDEMRPVGCSAQDKPRTDNNYPYLLYGNPYASQVKAPPYGYPNPPYLVYPSQNPVGYPLPQPHPIQYPVSPVSPPLPPPMPVTRQPERRSASPTTASPLDSDVENKEEITLSEPLTPLPAPLEPQRMETVLNGPSFDSYDEMDGFGVGTMLKVNLNSGPSAPPCPPDFKEDRFMDAVGEPMKMCRYCDRTFSIDIDEQRLMEHEMTHVEGICPVCKMMKSDNMTEEDFQKHVNKHLDADEEVF